jgi:hypothetical protein
MSLVVILFPKIHLAKRGLDVVLVVDAKAAPRIRVPNSQISVVGPASFGRTGGRTTRLDEV